MSTDDEVYETPKWRTAWLLVGFAVLIGIAVVTVVQPEITDETDETDEERASEIAAGEEQEGNDPLQE